ncbi:MAG: hypothetical protein ACAI44_06620 [Candidatus Sericytochromatia bacterium]
MLNQQDCARLLQQARYLEASWQSPLAPAALWPLCLGRDRIHQRQLDLHEQFSPAAQAGVLEVIDISGPLLPGSWQELPAEWEAPLWLRVQRFQGRKAYIGWEFRLTGVPASPAEAESTQLQLKLAFVVPLPLHGAVQAYFKRFSQALSRALKQLHQKELQADSPPADWSQLPDSALRTAAGQQLGKSGLIDPLRLAHETGSSLTATWDFLFQLMLSQLLEPRWYGLEPDEGPLLPDWSAPWHSPRWQTEVTVPGLTGLRFALPGSDLPRTAWAAMAPQSGRCLLWPGQTHSRTLQQHACWQLAGSEAQGRIRVRPQAVAMLELDVTLADRQMRELRPGGELRLHNPGGQLQLLCLTPPDQPSGGPLSLLSCQRALPLLLADWPEAVTFEREGCFLQLSTGLPAPLLNWLEQFLGSQDGSLLNSHRPLLLFERTDAALSCAEQLLQLLRRSQAWGLAEEAPRLALVRGRGLIHRQPEGLALTGPLAQRLDQLLRYSLGLDLILPVALLQDHGLSAPLRQSPWQLTEFSTGSEKLFQMRVEK